MKINQKLIYNSFAVLFLTLAAWIIVADKEWSAAGRGGIAFIMAALCAFIGNLDRIESFKASIQGVEGRTRELAERTENALDAVRRITLHLTKILIEMDAAAGRFGGHRTQEIDARRSTLLDALRSVGASEAEIIQADNADRKWVLIDYRTAIEEVAQALSSKENIPKISNIMNPETKMLYENDIEPSSSSKFSSDLKQLIAHDSALLDRLLVAYDDYLLTGRHTDPDIWSKRSNFEAAINLEQRK